MSVISYQNLWNLLRARGIKKKDLQEATRLSSAVIAKMGKGASVHVETLARICRYLKCQIADIVEISVSEV